jgi:hypothetical protein
MRALLPVTSQRWKGTGAFFISFWSLSVVFLLLPVTLGAETRVWGLGLGFRASHLHVRHAMRIKTTTSRVFGKQSPLIFFLPIF